MRQSVIRRITTLISDVTDAVMDEVKAWQNRALEPLYGILYLDALYVKMRHEGRVENRAVYVAIGVDMDGRKDVLGLWTSGNEGAKFWLGVLTELKNRGVKDVLIACVDGLKGFPQAIESVFPEARIQLCIVHMVRASLNYVNWKERKPVAADLKLIYRAATERQAEQELSEFMAKWGHKYQAIGKLWKENWERVIPFLEFPFPPPGESRGGRVPPTPEHAARQPKALARIMRRLPPQEAAAPLCIPRSAYRESGREAEGIDSRLQRKGITGAVYTKYLTLPYLHDKRYPQLNGVFILGSQEPEEFITRKPN